MHLRTSASFSDADHAEKNLTALEICRDTYW